MHVSGSIEFLYNSLNSELTRQKAPRTVDMLNQIIFLLITALQISFSCQCERHNQDNDSNLNSVSLPGTFPGGGNVPGVPYPCGHNAVPEGPVIPANLGPIGSNTVSLGPSSARLGLLPGNLRLSLGPAPVSSGPGIMKYNVGNWPSNSGIGPVNLGPAGINAATSPLPISNIMPIRLAELIASGAGLQIPSRLAPQVCIRHALVPVPVQVVEECITNVPVIRKTVRHQTETITRHVPIHEKTVAQQYEKIIRHVPVAQKSIRNVVETRVRHVPVIKSRSRTVIEPYTLHVPITERYTRPVEDSITRNVPYTMTRIRPIVTQRTRFVPVVERRCRPIVETSIQHVPVKRKYIRNVVEQRVRPTVGPCQTCCPDMGILERSAVQGLQPDTVSHNDSREYQEGSQTGPAPSDSLNPQNYQSIGTNSDHEGAPPSSYGELQQTDYPTSDSTDGCSCVTPSS